MPKICYQFKHENVHRVLSVCTNKTRSRTTNYIELSYIYLSDTFNLRSSNLYVYAYIEVAYHNRNKGFVRFKLMVFSLKLCFSVCLKELKTASIALLS